MGFGKRKVCAFMFCTCLVLSGCTAGVSENKESVVNPEGSVKPAVTESTEETESPAEQVTISFDTLRMTTEASNQIALWVEDESGSLIETLYVSDFTARRRGYVKRHDALIHWVAEASADTLSDEQIDAFSGATLSDGSHSFVWKMEERTSGTYRICLEGTLYWQSNVVYTAMIDRDHPSDPVILEERSEPENPQNADMIRNVQIKIS